MQARRLAREIRHSPGLFDFCVFRVHSQVACDLRSITGVVNPQSMRSTESTLNYEARSRSTNSAVKSSDLGAAFKLEYLYYF